MNYTLEDEPYSGVRALFNGDLQAIVNFVDRREWIVESRTTTRHLGESAITHVNGADRASIQDTV